MIDNRVRIPVALGLGSNLGNRAEHLRRAVWALAHGAGAALSALRLSPVYSTPALLPENAPPEWDMPYLNMVAAGCTRLSPEALLASIKQTETVLGRTAAPRWGPRLIDIDILAYGNHVLESDALTLPHPGLCERPFALVPLLDLWPDWTPPPGHPLQGKNGKSILSGLNATLPSLHADCLEDAA